MKIKWTFEENKEVTDEYGNLKSYYKNSEPWKKPIPKKNTFLQISKILIVLVVCSILVFISMNYQGYDWNQSGVRVIRDVVIKHLGIK